MVFEMIQAKQLKEIINRIPDDAVITIGGNALCDIIGFSESLTTDQFFLIADLKLTEGYCIMDVDFLETMYNIATNKGSR